MIAQSFVDYGALSSMAVKAERLMYSARRWAESLTPTEWIIVGVVLLVLIVWKIR